MPPIDSSIPLPLEAIYAPSTMEGSEGLLAIFVYYHLWPEGVTFFTPRDLGLQVGAIRHPAGYEVKPHIHLPRSRQVTNTQEVLLIRSGIVKIRVYTFSQEMAAERLLRVGDMVVLVAGGHSLTCLGEVEILEVKTGPYAGREFDKRDL